MGSISQIFENFFAVMRTFRLKDAIDIIAIGLIIYYLIKLVKETRAIQLVKGILILLVLYGVAYIFSLTMLTAMLNRFFEFAVIMLFIVFQPEIRKVLEQIGRSKYAYRRLKSVFTNDSSSEEDISKQQKNISVFVDAVMQLHVKKTGALIVFERRTRLGDIADTGTIVNASPSVMMIGNIFFNKAPLHDGAMIVRDGKIYAAGCILPLTHNENVDENLGTRHRAALGVSEVSDAVVVVVSEETGSVSIALNGELQRDLTRKTLTDRLNALLIEEKNELPEKLSFLSLFKKGEEKSEQ